MRPHRLSIWPPVPIEQIRLMGAVAEDFPLLDQALCYERKYDGIRVKIEIRAGKQPNGVTIWSRQDNVLTNQFPDLVPELDRIRGALTHSTVADGEIVAIDRSGTLLTFQDLQSRIGLLRPSARVMAAVPVALILFDLLFENGHDLRSRPLTSRRARLEVLLQPYGSKIVRLSRLIPEDGRALFEDAQKEGWEGIIAKRADSPYRSGKYHRDWRKLKLLLRQEFVIGGWTESARRPFRALLIGVYTDEGHFEYVGRMGKAFSDAELKRLAAWLHALEVKQCPFANRPDPDAAPHWVKPELVIEAKFNEWTKSGKLREPTYIGLRTDVDPKKVRREQIAGVQAQPMSAERRDRTGSRRTRVELKETEGLLTQIQAFAEQGGSGTLTFQNGLTLAVDKLQTPVWRSLGITKADLMRYYIKVSPYLLPTIADRPLTYRTFPHGVQGPPDRYHQRVKQDVPDGVRVESFRGVEKEYEPRFVGGSLLTLLYMVQHHVISQDAWLSTVEAPDYPDVAVIDLDPMPDVPFQQVIDVALWLHDELEVVRVPHFLKTSGAAGLHVFMPLAPKHSFRQAWEFCELVARLVAQKHPSQATVERSVMSRGKRVYLDYLQNLPGKTIATAYSVRANEFAGVSTPLQWNELKTGVHPEDFTMRTIDHRMKRMGDLWATLRHATGIDLHS
jgi:bifunctional non-homologous end joining protein LigD